MSPHIDAFGHVGKCFFIKSQRGEKGLGIKGMLVSSEMYITSVVCKTILQNFGRVLLDI